MLSNLKKYHIILASKSPRRQELLRGMGVDFEILTKETPENYPTDLPLDEVPKYLSLQKSLAFNDEELPAYYLLITSDTVVICEGEILGKPKDREYYIEHCKPFDKAGAYGIQEWIGYVGISGLEGSFYNVMGLPTRKLYQCLKSF